MEELALRCHKTPFPVSHSLPHGRISLSGPETFLLKKWENGTEPDWICKSLFHFCGFLLGRMLMNAADLKKPLTLLTVGGVASNTIVRASLAETLSNTPVSIYHTAPDFCTDNAVGTAYLTLRKRRRSYPD